MKSVGKSIFTTKFQCFFHPFSVILLFKYSLRSILCSQILVKYGQYLPDYVLFNSVTITLCLSICLHCVKSEWLLFHTLSSKTVTNYQVSHSSDNGLQWGFLADQRSAFQNTYFFSAISLTFARWHPRDIFEDVYQIGLVWADMILMHFSVNLCLCGPEWNQTTRLSVPYLNCHTAVFWCIASCPPESSVRKVPATTVSPPTGLDFGDNFWIFISIIFFKEPQQKTK